LCVASGIRAMPEKEKPPAMRVDDYFDWRRRAKPGFAGKPIERLQSQHELFGSSGDLFPEK